LIGIDAEHRPAFRTKKDVGAELLRSAASWLKPLGKSLWLVVDGASAKAPFLKPAVELGFTVVSRLRKDEARWCVPGQRVPGRRGQPRSYGEDRTDLAKRTFDLGPSRSRLRLLLNRLSKKGLRRIAVDESRSVRVPFRASSSDSPRESAGS
jgi:hypothetical protein